MAKVITEMNPKPMKLKFEKVFFQLVKQIHRIRTKINLSQIYFGFYF